MPYCQNCGNELRAGAKFCDNCGSKIENNEKRKTIFVGDIVKCPNCGEILDSFITRCPSCGYEIRNININDSIKDFLSRMEKAQNDDQKVEIITNYPIPNSKEDIYEFLLLASTNIKKFYRMDEKDYKMAIVNNAWMGKLEQCYRKASIVLSEKEMEQIQNIYNDVVSTIKKSKVTRKISETSHFFSKNIYSIISIMLSVLWEICVYHFSIHVNKYDGIALLIAIGFIVVGGIIVLQVSKKSSRIAKIITVIGLFALIILFIPKVGRYDSHYQILLFFQFVAGIVICIGLLKNNDSKLAKKDRAKSLMENEDISSFVTTLLYVLLMLAMAFLSTLI